MAHKRIPKYRLHKPSGQAVVTVRGKDYYLGRHGSPESRSEYDRLVARLLSGDPGPARAGVTLAEVLGRYWEHAVAQGYHHRHLDRIKRALGVARDLYGGEPAESFRGKALKACRERMVQAGWCRRVVNQRANCLKTALKWALSEEMISAEAYGSVRALPALLRGRTTAPESEAVTPAPAGHVEAALPFLPPFLADAARLQMLTACRPGEALALHAQELDDSRPVWVFDLAKHKTRWRGHRRLILVGPKGQELVRKYLRRACPLCGATGRAGRLNFAAGVCGACAAKGAEAVDPGWLRDDYYLFEPALARVERFEDMRAARKSPVQPSQADRSKAAPGKAPGKRYLVTSYDRAVAKACDRAGVPRWHPHQLRHAAATAIRAEFGIELAQIILGHASLQATEIYAAADLAKAMEAVASRG